MKSVVIKIRDFTEAEKREIWEQISATYEERQRIAKLLKKKYYGKNPPDVKDTREVNAK